MAWHGIAFVCWNSQVIYINDYYLLDKYLKYGRCYPQHPYYFQLTEATSFRLLILWHLAQGWIHQQGLDSDFLSL